jgi:high affinity Mn2+ porin
MFMLERPPLLGQNLALRRKLLTLVAFTVGMGLSGCNGAQSFLSSGRNASPAQPAIQPASYCSTCPKAQVSEGSAEKKSPGPHTFPEALQAYLHCLHSPPPSEKEQKKEGGGENSQPDNSDAKKENGEKSEKEPEDTWYSAHAQGTVVTQEHFKFRSPYVGPLTTPYLGANSLLPAQASATSETSTLFFAARMWEGGELVFNPEVAGGFGFNQSTGLAGFPNGEITRVGRVEPTPYIARLFFRQTIGLGGEEEKVEDGVNQVAGSRDVERLTITIGKLSNTDLVDDNRYSHDPRTSFLNWALMYNGAWDYPANVRGYTYGIGLEYNQRDWALRYTIMAEPTIANGAPLDPHFLKANGQLLEWEGRYSINDRPGKVRVWGFLNHAHLGNYSDALEEMPHSPDVTATRAYRFKYGYGGNIEQELTPDLGGFIKYGWNDGQSESWAFTAIDSTVAVGLLLRGRCWCRPGDVFGVAFAANGLSNAHRDYLAAGGFDFNIGDGRLRYGLEKILESFYNLQVHKGIFVTLDYQLIDNPAYNRDRGPVSVLSGRFHIEF